jgi:hypothetical protein
MERSVAGRAIAAVALAVFVVGVAALPAQSQAPATAAKAKELAGLLQAKKLEAIAARVPGDSGRYVAALLIPNIQLLTVTALHGRPMDTEYYLYNKDFKTAYIDLNSSSLVTERIVVDDALGDGLVALPGKSLAHDAIVKGSSRQIFDGDFADPRRKNQKKISQDDYMKAFGEAEQQYLKVLGILIDELKKAG